MLEVRVFMWMIQTYQFSVINTLKVFNTGDDSYQV